MTQLTCATSTTKPDTAWTLMAKRNGTWIMQPLTAMTLAALVLGAVAFFYDQADAQTPSACASHEASLYFEKGRSELNSFSKDVARRIAEDAKSCGASEVVAETRLSGARADVIARTFESMGVKVVLVQPHLMLASATDTVADRAATVRIIVNSQVG